MPKRKPGAYFAFLLIGLLALVGAIYQMLSSDWLSAGAQAVVALACLSVPFRLAR